MIPPSPHIRSHSGHTLPSSAATVAEICARAGANIAAVNYYFGGKVALYQEAWRHCLAES
ncbi:TetR family transcriptional regulator, partial [Enterococcus faecalis]